MYFQSTPSLLNNHIRVVVGTPHFNNISCVQNAFLLILYNVINKQYVKVIQSYSAIYSVIEFNVIKIR